MTILAADMRTHLVTYMKRINNLEFKEKDKFGNKVKCFRYPRRDLPYSMPSAHWEWTPEQKWTSPPDFRLKEGISSALAIKHIFDNPTDFKDQVRVDCRLACILAYYRSALKCIGDDAKIFDGWVSKLIHHYNSEYVPKENVRRKSIEKPLLSLIGNTLPLRNDDAVVVLLRNERTLKWDQRVDRGDWVYLHNYSDYGLRHKYGFWAGENAIVVNTDGNRTFFEGHGVTEDSECAIRVRLFRAYNDDDGADQKIPKKDLERKPIGDTLPPGLISDGKISPVYTPKSFELVSS